MPRVKRTVAEAKRAARNAYLMKHYGVTIEWYEATLAMQLGRCALCGRKSRFMAVDHAHYITTPNARAILCLSCNRDLIGPLDRGGLNAFDRAIALLNRYRDQLATHLRGVPPSHDRPT